MDSRLASAVEVSRTNIRAATTKEEAGAVVAHDLDVFQNAAEKMGWTGPDLAQAYNEMLQEYNAWQPPMVAENAGSQVVISETDWTTSDAPAADMVIDSPEVPFEPAGLIGRDSGMFVVPQHRTLGKVIVATGVAAASLGLLLLIWRAYRGEGQYRAW